MTALWLQSQTNASLPHDMTDLQFNSTPPSGAISAWQTGQPDDFEAPSWVPESEFACAHYKYIDFTTSHEAEALWCHLKPSGRPNFSQDLLAELIRMGDTIRYTLPTSRLGSGLLNYFVLASRVPNVFNLGGDLEFFCTCIREGQRERLRAYAYACIDALYSNHTGYDRDITTIALVQGEALGGGFEAALSCDVIIAEKQARFGLPEARFNLFPGMGAYSFLARRLGSAKAQQLILSGNLFSAAEMASLGIVDVLVDAGGGESAVHEYIARNRARHRACAAFSRARRRVNPVTIDELRDVTNIWVEAAFRLSEHDLRKMIKIATAQNHYG